MRSIYVSFGSEFADQECLDAYCRHNSAADLTVVLFSDLCKSKRLLKRCYMGVELISLKHKCCNSVGMFDSIRCEREYALLKVRSFARDLLSLVRKYSTSATSGGNVFLFTASLNVTSKVEDCAHVLENSVDHFASSELIRPATDRSTRVTFRDLSTICCFSRVVTSPYRYVDTENLSIARHVVPDASCKVGLVTCDADHASVLTSATHKMFEIACLRNRSLLGMRYSVYCIDGTSGRRV